MRPTTLRGIALALTFTAAALADDSSEALPAGVRGDVGKRAIEAPVERTLVDATKLDAPSTSSNATAAVEACAVDGRPKPREAVDPANPKVRPGLVRWHADADEAFAAARKSGKPVLVFQLLGSLDDEFC